MTEATAPDIVQLFLDNIYKLHGLSTSIVSNQDTCFTSKFWQSLFKLLNTKLLFSTAFHPQTDRQTERINCTLEEILRAYSTYKPRSMG